VIDSKPINQKEPSILTPKKNEEEVSLKDFLTSIGLEFSYNSMMELGITKVEGLYDIPEDKLQEILPGKPN
jgi:hypothetical protein